MADFASLQFEMERRSILFTANTTMPDNSLLGFEGNPNSIVSPSTAGQTLIYNSPRGTNYLQLSNGTLWFKNASPNTWVAVADAQLSGYVNNIDSKINSLSGAAVLTYGDQYIDGQKIFRGEVRIKDLYVTGTETIVNTINTNVASNYLLLNATGGAIDAGIFIVTGLSSGTSGVPLTGANNIGAVIGYDVPANRWVFGNTSRDSDLSQLEKIAGITDITNYSGFVNSNFYSINNPSGFITGIDLSSYATVLNLELTGQNLQSQLNNKANLTDIYNAAVEWTANHTLVDGTRYLAGDLVYVSGKIYKANYDNESIPVTSTLYWTDLGIGYRLNIDGRDIPNIPVSPAIQAALNDKYSISNPSGFITGVDLSQYLTGVDLSPYVTKVSGEFLDRPTVNGTGVLLSGEAAGTANFRYVPVSGIYNLVSNNRYSFDTLTGLVTGILPASPQKGDEIELYDSAGTWHLNPLIVDNNGNYIEQRKDMLECNVRHGLIKLIYTKENNIGWRIYPMPIHNVPLFLPPSIAITGFSLSGIIPFYIALTGISLLDQAQYPVDEWYWNLNTGDGYVVSGQTIAYTYLQTGLYDVTLSGSNAAGFDIEHQLINVFLPYTPTVLASSNKLSGIAPFTGQLSAINTTQPSQYSPVDNWYWDFDNDQIFDFTGQNTTVIYNQTGVYNPTAYAVNLGGTGTGSIIINIVEPLVPIPAIATQTLSGYAPLTIQFSGVNLQTPIEFSPVDHWYWDISGDSVPEFDQRVINYTFNETGTYTLYLTATNSVGSGTASGIITVLELPPTGAIIDNYSDYVVLLMNFNI